MSSQLTDSIGRFFDPNKFKNAKDTLGRWINARAGRKSTKKTKPAKSSRMNTDANTPAPETATPPAAEPATHPAAAEFSGASAPASSNAENGAAGSTPKAEPAPDFSDIKKAVAAGASPETLEADLSELQTTIAAGSTPTAETIIGILQTVLVLIGEEEGILTDGEKILLRPALNRVLKKYDVGNDVLPAEVDLLVAVAGLIVSRLKKPKTAKFAAKVRAWCVGLWFGHKGREIQRIVTREASQ